MMRPDSAASELDREEKTMDTTMNDDDDEDEMIGSHYRSELNSMNETELASPPANAERCGNDSDEIEEENSPLKSRGESRLPT